MCKEMLEEVTLVNEAEYLHIKENSQGFLYTLFAKDSKEIICDGMIDWTEIYESPIANPLVAARHLAFTDIGIEVEKVVGASLDVLNELKKQSILQELNHIKSDTREPKKLLSVSREEIR